MNEKTLKKNPNIQRFLRIKSTTASVFRRKIPLIIPNCGLTYVKIGIYMFVMVYSHMKVTLWYLVFLLLYHIKGFNAKRDLCSYLVNPCRRMSQNLDTYVTFKASLSLQIRTYIWNLLLQVSTVLIMIVVKTGRCFKKNKNQHPDVIHTDIWYLYLVFLFGTKGKEFTNITIKATVSNQTSAFRFWNNFFVIKQIAVEDTYQLLLSSSGSWQDDCTPGESLCWIWVVEQKESSLFQSKS